MHDLVPGERMVTQGIDDLAAGRVTEDALVVSLAPQRLMQLGHEVPEVSITDGNRRLYRLLEERDPATAYSRYLALTRLLHSYLRVASHARAR